MAASVGEEASCDRPSFWLPVLFLAYSYWSGRLMNV